MTKFHIIFEATDTPSKISDVKDFRWLFMADGRLSTPPIMAKRFIEALYKNQTQILEVTPDQLCALFINRERLQPKRPRGFRINEIKPVPLPTTWFLETY